MLLLLPLFLTAQASTFFTVSATGPLSSGESTSSLPIQFSGNSDCLKINSGLAVYSGARGSQSFVMACRTSNNEPIIELTLFPNPTTAYSRLISSVLLRSEQQLIITVVDSKGRVVLQLSKSADQLFAGADINFQQISAGSYFMRIDGRVIHQVIPFIKMN